MTADRPDDPLGPLRRSVADDDGIDPMAADRIEAGLRVAHAARRPSPAPWRRAAVLVPVAALLVVALAVGMLARDEQRSAAFVVTDAENVTVVLPDGTLVRDPGDGFVLPDGARVEIGTGGRVTIDDVTIDESAAAAPVVLEVRDGRLISDVVATTTTPQRPDHLDPDPSTTEPPTDLTTTTTVPVPTTARPGESPTTTRPPATDEAPTTTAPVTDDEADRGDEPRPDDPPDNGRDDPRDDDPEREPDDPPTLGLTLDLHRVDGGIEVTWFVDGLDDTWSIVVFRVIDGETPTPIVTTTDPSGAALDPAPRGDRDGPRPRYRLVVLDEAGGEVAAGPLQSLR